MIMILMMTMIMMMNMILYYNHNHIKQGGGGIFRQKLRWLSEGNFLIRAKIKFLVETLHSFTICSTPYNCK